MVFDDMSDELTAVGGLVFQVSEGVSDEVESINSKSVLIVKKTDVIKAVHNELLRPEYNRYYFNFKIRGVFGEYMCGKPISKLGEKCIIFEMQPTRELKKFELSKLEFECKLR